MEMTHKENAEVVKKYFDENDWHYHMTESEEVTFFEGGVEPVIRSVSSNRFGID